MSQPSATIIGAGIVGVSAAAFLQREGYKVTIIDRVPPGEGASFGNAGGLAFAEIVPTVHPHMLMKIPGWLLDPLGPLTIRWSYLPKALPWFISLARNSMPDRVKAITAARADLAAGDAAVGVDAIETNTFGANWANLAEYGIEDRIYELAFAGGKIAREAADAFSTEEKPRFVLGSLGPGTKLPSLGHTTYSHLKDAYYTASKGLVDSGCDALLIETTQDLLQAKAAVNGARQAVTESKRDVVVIAQVTVETTGTMLLGSEIGAALNALEPLDIDLIGLNSRKIIESMSDIVWTINPENDSFEKIIVRMRSFAHQLFYFGWQGSDIGEGGVDFTSSISHAVPSRNFFLCHRPNGGVAKAKAVPHSIINIIRCSNTFLYQR